MDNTDFNFEGEGSDFERERGKIIKRSQANVIRAIRELGLRFETDDFSGGDFTVIRKDGTTFFLSEDFPLRQVWLEIERRFHFRPAWTFFRLVLLDYAVRNAVHVKAIDLDE